MKSLFSYNTTNSTQIMCGRYSLIATEKRIVQELPFTEETGVPIRDSYNIAPTQSACVITNEEPYRVRYLTWGLIPSWSKDGKKSGKLINARAESIFTKPSFRVPIRRQRCLVVADSFYEWKRNGTRKLPYRILPADDSLLVMAGIWEEWKGYGETRRSFSIITTPPNAQIAELHNRSPVVLTDAAECQNWLENNSLDDLNALMQPARDAYFRYYRVSEMVNSVHNNSPHLHEPVPEERDLFSA